MAMERPNGTTMKGNPLTLIGPELKPGDKAPDFSVRTHDLAPYTLADSKGKVRLITAVPSLDTPVCARETRRFNREAARLGEGVELITISMDLPFAQKRWCTTAYVERIKVVSDYYDRSFAQAYGTLIKELQLSSRAVFVVDGQDTVRYVEYVPEATNEPNYDRALAAVRSLTGES